MATEREWAEANLTEYRDAEVAWYRKHGKYKERIAREGVPPYAEYLIGDEGWSRKYPGYIENIEHEIAYWFAHGKDRVAAEIGRGLG